MMYAPFFGLALHMLFSLALLVGLTCGVVWLARFATKEQLKRWFKWLFLIGLLGVLLTGGWAHRSMYKMMERWDDKEGEGYDDEDYDSMGDIMKDMMDWDDDEDAEDAEDASSSDENVTAPVEDSDASTTTPDTTTTNTSSDSNTNTTGNTNTVPGLPDTTDNTTTAGGNAN